VSYLINETQTQVLQFSKKEKKYIFEVVIEPDGEYYHAYCPILDNCHTWGDTKEEAYEYVKDAVKLYLDVLIADRQPIPGIGIIKSIDPIICIKETIEKDSFI